MQHGVVQRGVETGPVARAGGRRHLKPALLSGLVFPGLGQLANRRPWRAVAFGGGSLVLLVMVFRRVWSEALVRMPQDPENLLDPALPFRLAQEVRSANSAFFFWATCGLVTLWLLSVLDAWLDRRRMLNTPGSVA